MAVVGLWKTKNLEIGEVKDHFWGIGQALLQGKTYFLFQPSSTLDMVERGGKYYWPLGLGPAILWVPLVWINDYLGLTILMLIVNGAEVAAVLFLAAMVARKKGFEWGDAGYLATAVVFASVFFEIAMIPWSWRLSHMVTVGVSLLAVGEYVSSRRYWVLGILVGLVFMTRFTAGLGVIFFVLNLWWDLEESWKAKIIKTGHLLAPIAVAGVVLLVYNFVRFGNVWENGYWLSKTEYMWEREKYGLFKLSNIPTNFYYYFVRTIDPVLEASKGSYYLKWPYIQVRYPGVGFWVVAPVFMYVFRASWEQSEVKAAWGAVGIIILFLLSYYWVGWGQLGPRYMNDALPWLYVLLLLAFPGRKLTNTSRGVILGSVLLNMWLFATALKS